MVISEDYRDLQAKLHKEMPNWGSSARLRAPKVQEAIKEYNINTVLDYGCGKGVLKEHLTGVKVDEYDPCIPGKDKILKPKYDMVASLDVLEHVEPEYVEDVIKEINDHFTKCAYLLIYLVEAKHILPDGTNCHKTVKPAEWWLDKVSKVFKCDYDYNTNGVELTIIARR